MHSLKKTPIR